MPLTSSPRHCRNSQLSVNHHNHKQASHTHQEGVYVRGNHPVFQAKSVKMSSSSLSKKASSFVVTASMSAVEALKDQAGLCRWDYALRSLYQRAAAAKQVTGRAVPVSLSSQTGGAAASSSPAAACGRAARSKRSEEEKMQKAYHLVCWGPN
ncbi:uncharacterized protein LOC127777393 [Oryza glaberrima]|nr:uncharacterized protein LOC127777393 [Oryza glaberrima]